MTTRMTVGTQDYLLSENTDVSALQVEICDAMRRGSGIVSVDLQFSAPVTFVVSPGVPVTFELVADAVEFTFASDRPFSVDDWESFS